MSKKILVIVESPGKISKIKQYLGDNYIVKASFGHVQDLDKKTLSIEIENNFNPLYVTNPDKIKIVKELKDIAKNSSDIILASDGDREGEAIAHSLARVLNFNNPKRIIFNEITKTAIQKAIENPITINYNMVNAQQARRILDRLVGYKISPILWKHINDNNVISAGRVQSAVVNIIINKENEILNSITNPYYKIKGEFSMNTEKFHGYLNNTTSYFTDENKIKDFLKLFNKKTIFKVVNIENKITTKKPSAPFITSSLQQEASTKLHFSVVKTMKVAQKLYENGLITYMRSDCPNISNDALEEIKKFIVSKWGDEYSELKNYTSKNSTSQDAHECIRPTQINVSDIELDSDSNKLYNLIWKRTIASQMTPAKINIQNIDIDALNNNKSILLFNTKQLYFNSTFENVEFQGHLIIYDNYNIEDASSEKNTQKTEIKINDILNFLKLHIFEDYNKLPLRYNEAGLVKYLEKNSIGRPSTYASIISKILERNYVEIKNIDGIKKDCKYYELNKKYEIKESLKEIYVGKENKKIIPTEIGINVNNFMLQHFNDIIDIHFTANFESYLDKIATGQANWVTVLKMFYDTFEPIINNLTIPTKTNDKLLGKINNTEVYLGSGKYGPYVKIYKNTKWKYASINNLDPNNITLEDAYELLQFPIKIGKINNNIVTLNQGKYGLYLCYDTKNFSINNYKINYKDIDINFAKKIINK